MEYGACVVVVLRTVETDQPGDYARALTEHGYRLEYVLPGHDPAPAIELHRPVAVCFQFDYPYLAGLAELRQTKQLLPGIPLLMVTRAHSEQLAVWAFRSRVWDYFIEPVDTTRLLDVVNTLANIRRGIPALPQRASLDRINAIPPEARSRCSGSSEDQATMERVLTYLDANLHKKIVQVEIAKLFGLSPFQFSRLFKRVTNVTFQAYLLTRRIDEAKRLLANPKASVTDICFTVGFQDLSYFTRVFQRYGGLTPSRYRLAQQRLAEEALATAETPPEPIPAMPSEPGHCHMSARTWVFTPATPSSGLCETYHGLSR